jgi:hypothetical protein
MGLSSHCLKAILAKGLKEMAAQAKTAEKPRLRCFVISPIGDAVSPERLHSDMVLNSIIRPALPEFVVKRGDELGPIDMIGEQVIEAIFDYEMAVADLTGHNPNVFYELGLRHMIELPVVLIAQQGTKIPFDAAGVRTIFFNIADWNSHTQARRCIEEAAAHAMSKTYKLSNPVTQARASLKLAESSDPKDVILSNLIKRVEELEKRERDSFIVGGGTVGTEASGGFGTGAFGMGGFGGHYPNRYARSGFTILTEPPLQPTAGTAPTHTSSPEKDKPEK